MKRLGSTHLMRENSMFELSEMMVYCFLGGILAGLPIAAFVLACLDKKKENN